jgi:hypothetical protein
MPQPLPIAQQSADHGTHDGAISTPQQLFKFAPLFSTVD